MRNCLESFKNHIPGILLCLLIAIAAWLLGEQITIIGGAVFGIILGIIAALFMRPAKYDVGIRFTSKKILQYSIILLGFEMNIGNILKVGAQSLFVIIFTLTASFITAFLVSKMLKMPSNISILIGVGTSICGGSAIAATAPVIKAKDEEVAQAISTIFLFNIIAVFLFPALGHLIGLSDIGFGMWSGTAINDTSSVVAASSSWSQQAGNSTSLQFATIVKLTRTLMIVPITLVLAIYTSRQAKMEASQSRSTYSFRKVFPWFVLGFVTAALIYTFLPIPATLASFLVKAGKFMIVMAMAAVGLNTNLKKLLTQSTRPLLLGLCCWGVVSVVSLLVQMISGRI